MIYSAVLSIIDAFGSFVAYFFQPIPVLQSIFGQGASLFTVVFGAGLITFVGYTLAKWFIPT